MRYAAPFLLLLTGLVAPSSRPVETSDFLLSELASPDPRARSEAAQKLLAQGVAARPSVLAATHAASPEIRTRAAELLLKLPWSKPTDPGEVQRVLNQYGQHDPAGRAHDVYTLANFSDRAGHPALVRLLTEDPADSVRWSIVTQLHSTPIPDGILAPLREIDPADQPAPILAGMALAHRKTDLPKSQSLYQQACAALAQSGAAPEVHLNFGELLLEHGLRSLARTEMEAALATPGTHAPLVDANAHFQLASLIGDSDDKAAADHIQAGLDAFKRIDGAGLTVDRPGARASGNDALADLKAEMHFRYYRAATKSGNHPQAAEHLTQLLELSPSRADVVLEIVPALKSLHRDAEARAMFDRAYKPLRSAVDADPSSAENYNNLAWLCARCGERPDEAVQLATRALELAPDNPAYLDTAAEAHFLAGHAEQAAKLESRALELRPGDEFMQDQLKRFRSATTTTKAAQPGS